MKSLYEGILSDIETTISTSDINVKKLTIVKALYSNNKKDILNAIDDLHDILKALRVKTIKDVNKIKSSYNYYVVIPKEYGYSSDMIIIKNEGYGHYTYFDIDVDRPNIYVLRYIHLDNIDFTLKNNISLKRDIIYKIPDTLNDMFNKIWEDR